MGGVAEVLAVAVVPGRAFSSPTLCVCSPCFFEAFLLTVAKVGGVLEESVIRASWVLAEGGASGP